MLSKSKIFLKVKDWTQIISPHLCIFCEGEALLSNNPATCLKCDTVQWQNHRCPRCQRACHKHELEKSRCYRCKSIHYPFKTFQSIGPYRKTLRKAILRAKFHQDPLSIRFLNRQSLHLELPSDPEIHWSYVPSAPKRLKERGSPQQHTPLMFEKLRKIHQKTFTPLLIKTSTRRPQIELNEKERRQGLDESLTYCGPSTPPKTVILFDDVWSTGTTLNSAARVLKSHDIQNIHIVTLAFNDLTAK